MVTNCDMITGMITRFSNIRTSVYHRGVICGGGGEEDGEEEGGGKEGREEGESSRVSEYRGGVFPKSAVIDGEFVRGRLEVGGSYLNTMRGSATSPGYLSQPD